MLPCHSKSVLVQDEASVLILSQALRKSPSSSFPPLIAIQLARGWLPRKPHA